MKRPSPVTITALAIALTVLATSLFIPFARGEVQDADIKGDWVLAKALLEGDNPYADMHELSLRYSNGDYRPSDTDPEGPEALRSPRLPGAIVLSLPWLLIPYESVVFVNTILNIACLFYAYVLISRHLRATAVQFWAVAALLSIPNLWQVRYSNLAGIIALLLVAVCILSDKSDSRFGGILLAVAAVIKTYPLILIGLLVARRQWRAVTAMGASLIVLNVPPLFLPSIPFSHALDAIMNAGSRFGYIVTNLSLTRHIEELSGSATVAQISFVLLVGAAMIWVYRRQTITSLDGMFLVSVGVLMTPISWPHYLLVVFPFAAWTYHSHETPDRSRLLILAAATFAVIPERALTGLSLYILVLTATAVRWWVSSGRRLTSKTARAT